MTGNCRRHRGNLVSGLSSPRERKSQFRFSPAPAPPNPRVSFRIGEGTVTQQVSFTPAHGEGASARHPDTCVPDTCVPCWADTQTDGEADTEGEGSCIFCLVEKGSNRKSHRTSWYFSVAFSESLPCPASPMQGGRGRLQDPALSGGKPLPRPHCPAPSLPGAGTEIQGLGAHVDPAGGNRAVLQSQADGRFSVSKRQTELLFQNASGLPDHSVRSGYFL